MLHVRSGDMVAQGQPLATVYASDEARLGAGVGQLEQAFVWATGAGAATAGSARSLALALALALAHWFWRPQARLNPGTALLPVLCCMTGISSPAAHCRPKQPSEGPDSVFWGRGGQQRATTRL
jgi:hypothetical protein